MKKPTNKLQFKIGIWDNGEKYLKHCGWHQPESDPEIKREIQILCEIFRIKIVTTGICEECAEKAEKEII